MEKFTLKAVLRDLTSKETAAKKRIPAVLYGKETENKNLWVDYQEFRKIHEQAGESTVISLAVEGNGKDHNVLIYDVQYNPLTDEYQHLDFYQVKMDEEITTEVELVFVGEAPAVKEKGGVLVKNMDNIEVTALPSDLPSEIEVNISKLATFEDYIYVKDLPLSNKVKVDIDPETVIALVAPPRTEEELSQLDEKVEIDMDKIEGMKKEEKTEEPAEKK